MMNDIQVKVTELVGRKAYDEALTVLQTAVLSPPADPIAHAELLNNMGVVQRMRRDYSAAQQALTQAQALFAAQGDAGRQGQALANLADVYADQKQRGEAAKAYSQAASLLVQSGDQQRQSQVLRAMSILSMRQQHWIEAMMRMEESLTVKPRLGLGGWLYRALLRFALGLLRGGG